MSVSHVQLVVNGLYQNDIGGLLTNGNKMEMSKTNT
jgi:hypothetical protein